MRQISIRTSEVVFLNQLFLIEIFDSLIILANSLEENSTMLNFPTAYYPQTHGQTKLVNYSLQDLFQCLIGDLLAMWDIVLTSVDFAYTSLVNRPIRLNPLKIVTDISLKTIHILPLPIGERLSLLAESFAQYFNKLYMITFSANTISHDNYKSTEIPLKNLKKASCSTYVFIQGF